MYTCHRCKAPITKQSIDYMAHVKSGYVLVRALEVEKCSQCGEVYLDGSASAKVDAAIRNAAQATEHIDVPVVHACGA